MSKNQHIRYIKYLKAENDHLENYLEGILMFTFFLFLLFIAVLSEFKTTVSTIVQVIFLAILIFIGYLLGNLASRHNEGE